MRRILIDSDVILDVLLAREPFLPYSVAVFAALKSGLFFGYVTAGEITNVFYVLRKLVGNTKAKISMKKFLQDFRVTILNVNRDVLIMALESPMSDFEDAVLAMAAEEAGLDAIVTRNKKDYKNSPVTSMLPREFCVTLGSRAGGESARL